MNYLRNLKKFIFYFCFYQIIITTASNIFAGENDKKFNEFYQKSHVDIDHSSDYNNYLNTSYNLYSNTAQEGTSYNNYNDFYSLYNLDLDYSYFIAQASILPALSLPMVNYKTAAIFALPVLSFALYHSLENLTSVFTKHSQKNHTPNNNPPVLFQEIDDTKSTFIDKLQSLDTKTYDNLVGFLALMDKNSSLFDQNDPHIKLIHDSLSDILTEHKDYKTNPEAFFESISNSTSRRALYGYLYYLDKSKVLFTKADINLILNKFYQDWLKQIFIDKDYSSLIFIDTLLIKKYKDFFSTWYLFFLTDYFDSYKKTYFFDPNEKEHQKAEANDLEGNKFDLIKNHLDYAQDQEELRRRLYLVEYSFFRLEYAENEEKLASDRLSKLALLDHTVHKSLNVSDDHEFLKKQLINTAKHYLSNARFKYLARIITRATIDSFDDQKNDLVYPLKAQKNSVEFPFLRYESQDYNNNVFSLYDNFKINFELLDQSPKVQTNLIFNADRGIAKTSVLKSLIGSDDHFLLNDTILALNIMPKNKLQDKKDMDLIYFYPLVEEYMIIDRFQKVTSIDYDKTKKVKSLIVGNRHNYLQEKLLSAGVLRSFKENNDNNFQFIPLNSGARKLAKNQVKTTKELDFDYNKFGDFLALMDKNSSFFNQNDPYIELIHGSLSDILTEHEDYKTNPESFLNSISNSISRRALARYLHYLDKSKILFTKIDINLILDKFYKDWLKQIFIDKDYSSLIFIDDLLIKKYKDFFSTWYLFFLTDYFDSYKKTYFFDPNEKEHLEAKANELENDKFDLIKNHLDYAQDQEELRRRLYLVERSFHIYYAENEETLASNRLSKLALLDNTVHKSLNVSDDHEFLKKQLINTAKHYLSNARFKYLARIITRATLDSFDDNRNSLVHPLKTQKNSLVFPFLRYESQDYNNNVFSLYDNFKINFELLDQSPKVQTNLIFNADRGIAKTSILGSLIGSDDHLSLDVTILALNIMPKNNLQDKKDMDLIYFYPLVEEYMIIDRFQKVTSIDYNKTKKVENLIVGNRHNYLQEKLLSAGVFGPFENDDNNFQFFPLNSDYELKQLNEDH